MIRIGLMGCGTGFEAAQVADWLAGVSGSRDEVPTLFIRRIRGGAAA